MRVSFAWWLKPYLYVLAFCCVMAGTRLDEVKLVAKIKRATRITVR